MQEHQKVLNIHICCGNDSNIINDLKKNKVTKSNYTTFQYKLIKKFEQRSKERQIYYQSKYSLLRWSYEDIKSKANKINEGFKKESSFILNLVAMSSDTEFTPIQFVIYSTSDNAFYTKCNRDDALDYLL